MLMRKWFPFSCLVVILPLVVCAEEQEIKKKARRVQAHVCIKDFQAAHEEAKNALALYPHAASLHEAYIRSLARLGREKEMLRAWNNYLTLFPEQNQNRELIEEMAWGVLGKASQSHSLITRQLALLAAFFCQEGRGVDIIHQGMRDSNYAIRAFAVKLAGHLHDEKLIAEIKRLFREEKMRPVRHEVIKAVGQMKILELQRDLEALISSEKSLAEEKAVAIASLLALLESIQRNEVIRLVSSNRAGLRLLACQAIAHFHSLRDLDQLLNLTSDYRPDVRAAAYQAIGLIRPKESQDAVLKAARRGIQDSHFKAALSAAWLLTLYVPNEGAQAIQRYLMSDKQEVRLVASSALAATGHYGAHVALPLFERHADPYVRLNLALGLIGQRLATERAAQVVKQVMVSEKEKWCEVECGIFNALSNCQFSRDEESSSTPEMDNQLIRLKLFNILAVLKEPDTQGAVREFLAERVWGISGAAAALLLTEGDEEAVELVQQLLQDKHPKVRIQAALVLSLWSHEETPIQVLEQGYANGDKETKTKILEGLGRIGSMASIPFLIQTLNEPSQTLRLIAAMALIQCLNH